MQAAERSHLLGTYNAARPEGIAFVSGRGCELVDCEGRTYLDFAAGIAVNCLGHSDPAWAAAVAQAASTLTHVSNLYSTPPAARLAQTLCEAAAPWAGKAFFANSGTEANEAALKFARKHQRALGYTKRTGVVAFTRGFHGRTMGSLALTHKAKYRTPFAPGLPGVTFAEYGDVDSAGKAIRKGQTAAVFVEPVQGEGGCHPADFAFLKSLRRQCDEAGALLVYDEVQTGLGRCGTLFAHEAIRGPGGEAVMPDLMTLAKPLAGGLPIGAVLMTDAVASAIAVGDHGSTFAGGPLVCTAALHVLERITGPGFLDSVNATSTHLVARLRGLEDPGALVEEVRGLGLLVGVQMTRKGAKAGAAGKVVAACRERGVLVITAGEGDVVRLVPPLIATPTDADRAVDAIQEALIEVHAQMVA